ncbi:MAG: hypothetical protein D6719_05915 [Candidatus Dadabacteria bacterium]|nr:MAG: hypothetical protein D6719_05915 [Candidatus Dadabacteria bacterium]
MIRQILFIAVLVSALFVPFLDAVAECDQSALDPCQTELSLSERAVQDLGQLTPKEAVMPEIVPEADNKRINLSTKQVSSKKLTSPNEEKAPFAEKNITSSSGYSELNIVGKRQLHINPLPGYYRSLPAGLDEALVNFRNYYDIRAIAAYFSLIESCEHLNGCGLIFPGSQLIKQDKKKKFLTLTGTEKEQDLETKE